MTEERCLTTSLILLTRNSAETASKCLDSIMTQTRPPDEVIVVDGSSNDQTEEIVRRYPVKVIREPGLGYGYARNLGLANSTGEIVLFIDSDCYAERDWIERLIGHFKDPNVSGVTGALKLWNTTHDVARFLACVGGRMDPPEKNTVEVCPTMNLAIRRKIIDEVGGFDETLVRGEDTDFTYQVTRTHRIVYEPRAVVHFRGSPNLRTASTKCARHFVGMGQIFAKHRFSLDYIRLVKFRLPIRGLLLLAGILSLFLAPWQLSSAIFGFLAADMLYRMGKMYRKYRDRCVLYYLIFFGFWSILSLGFFYGVAKKLLSGSSTRLQKAAIST